MLCYGQHIPEIIFFAFCSFHSHWRFMSMRFRNHITSMNHPLWWCFQVLCQSELFQWNATISKISIGLSELLLSPFRWSLCCWTHQGESLAQARVAFFPFFYVFSSSGSMRRSSGWTLRNQVKLFCSELK